MLRSLFLICLTLSLSACIDQTGDFGRPKPNLVSNFAMPALGRVVVESREEPYSYYPYTQDEQVMRDRAWGLLRPAYKEALFHQWIADLRVNRIATPNIPKSEATDYSYRLLHMRYKSSDARWHRLNSDIRNDLQLMGGFFRVARQVRAADDKRQYALDTMPDMDTHHRAAAEARIYENEALAYWVYQELLKRHYGYRHAMERLFLMAPSKAAITSERLLKDMFDRLNQIAPLSPMISEQADPLDMQMSKRLVGK